MTELEIVSDLRNAGIEVTVPEYETIKRVKTRRKSNKKNGVYFLSRVGNQVTGWAKNYDEDINLSFKFDRTEYQQLSASEKKVLDKQLELLRAQKIKEDKLAEKTALKRATEKWAEYSNTGISAYLERKKIKNYGCKFNTSALVVPVRKNKDLVGLQYIYDDKKLFLTGTKKKGAYHKISGSETYALCEGYATGATIHEATGWTVIVCFDAGNLISVAETFTKKRKYIICGDNDDTGIKNAKASSSILNCNYVVPEKYNDYNDLAIAEGIEAVRKELINTVNLDVLTFPENAFPCQIVNYVKNRAWVADSHVDFSYAGILGTLSNLFNRSTISPFKGANKEFNSNLYILIVGSSGSAKTPMLDLGKKFLEAKQRHYHDDFREQMSYFKSLPKKEQKESEIPIIKTCLLTKGTIEAIKRLMRKNEEVGLESNFVYWIEEFSSFINGLGKYSGGKSDDMEELLTLWDSALINVACKDEMKSDFVKNAFLSLVGGIQPEVMKKLFKDNGSGFFQRFIFIYPEDKFSRRFVDRENNIELESEFNNYISNLDTSANNLTIPDNLREIEQWHITYLEEYAVKYNCISAAAKWKTIYYKLFILICGIWNKKEIDAEIMQKVFDLSKYFAYNWVKSAFEIEQTEEENLFDQVVEYLKEHGKQSLRELKRKKFKKKDQKMLLPAILKSSDFKTEKVGNTILYSLA